MSTDGKYYFHSEPDHRTPYTIVIPPPKCWGVLHMGHMLNNTIQDVLIRRARLKGFNAGFPVRIMPRSLRKQKLLLN
jgi:valyl-tRNA synthetase